LLVQIQQIPIAVRLRIPLGDRVKILGSTLDSSLIKGDHFPSGVSFIYTALSRCVWIIAWQTFQYRHLTVTVQTPSSMTVLSVKNDRYCRVGRYTLLTHSLHDCPQKHI